MSARTITWTEYEEAENAVVTHANSQLMSWLQPIDIGGIDNAQFEESINSSEREQPKPAKQTPKSARRKTRAHGS